MKLILLAFAFWIGSTALAVGPNTRVNCASTALGSSYTAVYPQLAITGLVAKSHFGIVNSTAGTICCNVVTPSPINPPTGGNGDERCFPASTYTLMDFVSISANVYCRSLSGSISTGTFDVWTW